MMKFRFFTIFTVVVMVVMCLYLLPAQAEAVTVTSGTCGADGDNLTWTLDDAGTLTISGTGAMKDDTSDGAPWYSDRYSIKTVVIQEGVTSIASGAFGSCYNLTSVTIPNSVETIGYYAFSGCDSLDYNYYAGDYYLGNDKNPYLALWQCDRSSTSCTINENTKFILYGAFAESDSLTSITIPAGMSSIDIYCIQQCVNLTSLWVDADNPVYSSDSRGVVFNKDKTTLILVPRALSGSYIIPDSVTSIGEEAFAHCLDLTSITIPNSVESIGTYAFWNCYSLSTITIPGSLTNTGDYAFYRCNGLTSVTFQDGVTSIGNGAFYACDSLTSVTIPGSVTSIGEKAFESSGLTDVYFIGSEEQRSVISIDENNARLISAIWHYAFLASGTCGNNLVWTLADTGTLSISGTGAMEDYLYGGAPWYGSSASIKTVLIQEGVTSIGESAFVECSSLSNIIMPDSLTCIGDYAFWWCGELGSVTIPSGVTCIGDYAFKYCYCLSIWVEADNTAYSSDDSGVLFNKDKTILLRVPNLLSGNYEIPESVITIGDYAFSECGWLYGITIPDSVISIGDRAFGDCYSLSNITIPDSVTSIGESLFFGCDNLTAVTIPNSVSTIGNWMFFNCHSLETIKIPDSVTSIGDYAFYDCSRLNHITIPEGVTSIGNYAFCKCEQLMEVNLPGSLRSIQQGAFENCRLLSAIELPDGLSRVGDYAFWGTGLRVITIPDSVESIGAGAFRWCQYLGSVQVGKGAASIGSQAFTGCTRLCSVIFSGDMPSIHDEAFSEVMTNIYYSKDNQSWSEERMLDYGGDLTWIAYQEGDNYLIARGALTDTIFWTLDNLGKLTIAGEGDMPMDEDYANVPPMWALYSRYISEIVVEKGITSISEHAFESFSGLNRVIIGPDVAIIGNGAFMGNASLTTVTVGNSVTSVGNYVFRGCEGLTNVYYGGTGAQWEQVSIGSGNEDLTSAQIHFMVCYAHDSKGTNQIFSTLTEALATECDYIQLCGDTAETVTVNTDAYLDLNGYTLTGDITIADGATLYVFDSATADYTAANRGKLLGRITGDLAQSFNTPAAYGHNYKYLALEEEDGVWSFHRYYLTVKSVVLRPYISGMGYTGTAVDYKTHFKCNELVAQYVTAYGTKLVGDNTAYSDYMANGYSLLAGAENTNEQCTWLTGTCKTTNSAEVNAANALRKPTVSAYITLADGSEITSAGVQRSLQDMIVYANGLDGLTAVEKKALGRMYDLFKDVLDTWTEVDITNIKRYAAELV